MQQCFHQLIRQFVLMCMILVFVNPPTVAAQSSNAVSLNTEYLYSTHGTSFPGATLSLKRNLNKNWALAIGVEYSGTSFHDDNGWNLYQLKFLPITISEYYYWLKTGSWKFFGQLQEGLSLISYDKEFENAPGLRNHMRESGLYGYAGLGTEKMVTKNSSLFVVAGMKGFHLSLNDLDVNPHGIAGKLGYAYYFHN